MPTPSIQTLVTDAQQVLNLDSISAIRSVVAVALANANVGTPLNPNLTTQQLWNEFYQVVNKPKSDIESIIANQLMKLLYAPPAPGGAGADQQVIFNDGGVLAGDPQFLWNKTTNLLTVTGSATITGAATVGTTLGVTGVTTLTGNAFANGSYTVAAGTPGAFTNSALTVNNRSGIGDLSAIAFGYRPNGTVLNGAAYIGYIATNDAGVGLGDLIFGTRNVTTDTAPTERYRINSTGVATWSNVGGVAGTAMTLNSTGLGVGVTPTLGLNVLKPSDTSFTNLPVIANFADSTAMAAGVGGGIVFSGRFDGTSSVTGYGIISGVKENGTSGNFAGALVFGTRDAGGNVNIERLRINSSGNVGVGVAPSTSRFFVKGDGTNIPVKIIGTTGDTTIPHLVIDKKDNNTTTSQLFIQFVVADNGAGSGQINANGVNQAAFGTYSDSRLKKNIVNLPSQLANILSLRPVEFDYKDGNGHQIGFIAQEMQEVYADAVGEQEGFLTVSGWNKTEARLVSAIKELAAKVQALEAKLA